MKTLNDMTLVEIATVREGAWAAMDKLPATACPYDPRQEDRMNAWLQGFVTESENPGSVNRLIFGR